MVADQVEAGQVEAAQPGRLVQQHVGQDEGVFQVVAAVLLVSLVLVVEEREDVHDEDA